jgi:WD40 repeat protein
MDRNIGRRPRWSEDDRTRLIEELCQRYRQEWGAVDAPRIEDYMTRVDGKSRTVLWLELVLLDQELRRDRGETPTLADYRESCPDAGILLDPSTAELHPPTEPAGDWDGPGPVPDEDTAVTGRRADASDPTPVSPGEASDRSGPPATVGPPRGADLFGVEGLAMARPGARLGDYLLLKKLGAGGMGVVFKAMQKRLNRVVALKMIRAGAWADARAIRMFRAEAEAVAALDHPHIVPILESGEHAGLLYYSMKLIEGRDLHDDLDRFRDRPDEAARLMAKVADAIDHAHRCGVLHRDLKPSNILVDAQGEPHVIDFGLAKRMGIDGEASAPGQAAGTPNYMAPEQALGLRGGITTATDVHGLGALLYTLLTGRPPFSAGTPAEVIHRVAHDQPARPGRENPRVDRDLEIICLKCLSKEPKDRYASAGDVADDLRRWLDGRPILARPATMRERVWKSARRHPAISTLIAMLAIAMAAGIGGIVWQWRRALAAREGMHLALDVARANEDRALASEDAARHLAYASAINLAGRDWRDAHVAQVVRHLDETRPAEGKADLRGFEWYYLDRLARAQALSLAGHGDTATSVAYSGDGRRLASSSWDGTVRLWDADTGGLIRSLRSVGKVYAVAFHPDGTRLASAGTDQTVTLWDAGTGQPIGRLAGHTKKIVHIAFTTDGKVLASTSWDGTVKLWDVDAGKLIRSLDDHRAGEAGDIVLDPDGKTLASIGGGEASIRFWDVATGRRVRTLVDDRRGPMPSLAISPDGKLLASGAGDGTIRLVHADDGSTARLLRDRDTLGIVDNLAFSRDGKVLISTHFTGQVCVWEIASGFLLHTIRGRAEAMYDIAPSPDGLHLASAGWGGAVEVWDMSRDQEARTWPAKAVVRDVAFAPDGSYLASVGLDGFVTLWDPIGGQPFRVLRGHTGGVLSVAIRGDGRRAASSGVDRTVRVWDVATGNPVHELVGHAGIISRVTFSPDGKTLASASADRTVRLWDADSGRAIHTLSGHIGPVTSVAFGADGKLLASAGTDGLVILWDPVDGRRLRTIQAHPIGILAVAVSRDGQWLASGGMEPTIKVWDVATGTEVHRLGGHNLAINRLVFSPDSRRLISAGDDRTVRIWDPACGRELMVLQAHAGGVWGVAMSPDGTRIASAGKDATIKLWEANAGPRTPLGP